MRKLVGFILVLCLLGLFLGCATQYNKSGLAIEDHEDGSRTVKMSPAAVRYCEDEGGCNLITRDFMRSLTEELQKALACKSF